MRLGLLPSQKRELQRAFKKAKAFDRFRSRTRRAFVGGGVAALGAAVASFWAGTRAGRTDSSATPESTSVRSESDRPLDGPLRGKLPIAHRFATAPDDELRNNFAFFLVVLDAHGGDDLLWAGFTRLARMAEAGTTDRDRFLAQRLLASARRLPPPPFAAEWLPRLQTRADKR